MDKFDWQIIQALQKNGRLTNQEIGDLIGLSASQCSRRRQLLEQKRRDPWLYGTHPATGARAGSYSDDSHKLKNTRGEITASFPRAD